MKILLAFENHLGLMPLQKSEQSPNKIIGGHKVKLFFYLKFPGFFQNISEISLCFFSQMFYFWCSNIFKLLSRKFQRLTSKFLSFLAEMYFLTFFSTPNMPSKTKHICLDIRSFAFQKFCISVGGNLASLHNSGENTFVSDMITRLSGSRSTWVGGYDAVDVSLTDTLSVWCRSCSQ